MIDAFDKMFWAYRAVFKQTDVGGGAIVVNIIAQERMVILYGLIGPNDYAAVRAIACQVRDTSGNLIGNALKAINMDNARVVFPATGEGAAVVVENVSEFNKHIVLGKGEYLYLFTDALVQNEELTIAVRALIQTSLPSVTTTGSAGTVTITTTYNKVI